MINDLNRRAALGGLGALSLAACKPKTAATIIKPARHLDLSTPQQNLDAYVTLIGSRAAEMRYTHYQGVLYGVVANDIPKPLMRFEALGKVRWTPQADGSYLRKSHDLGFFGDYETRQPIDSFINPYTGLETQPLHYKNGRGETLYTVNGPRLPWSGAKSNEDARPFKPDWVISGDEIWVDDEVSGERESWLNPSDWPKASSGENIYIRSTVTNKGFVSELSNPNIMAGRCTGIWTGFFPWLPWMLMGQKPGFLLWRSIARKIASPEEASDRILSFIDEREPDYLKLEDPWMERKNSWIDYTKTRKPYGAKP
ncbi:MAG: DUF1838 family protein [Alphaproteobacteria bacterium]